MKRPWQIWLAFAVCLAVVLAAMGWVTLVAVRLDREQMHARTEAAFEERVRLALWRVDAAVSPLIARENLRPYPWYSAFYFAGHPYSRLFVEILKDEVQIPSPLLTESHADIRLHFQLEPDGTLSSPQAPTGNAKEIVETRKYRTAEENAKASERLAALRGLLDTERLLAMKCEPEVTVTTHLPETPAQTMGQVTSSQGYQFKLNVQEMQARRQSQRPLQKIVEAEASNVAMFQPVKVVQGSMRPVWMNGELLLVRKVTAGKRTLVQGCWLDWPRMRASLLEEVKRDLLPSATLEPTTVACDDAPERLLATLPVRLRPGEVASADAAWFTPIVLSLVVAWACVLVAAGAVVMLLVGAVTLSERRGAFVSAVTHELRTPLTTFRMYTEMLEGDMVSDEPRRKEYLGTLRTEAERLGHLVENVLAYARLERGSARGRIETVTTGALTDRVRELLAARAKQAGMELVIENGDADVTVRADASAVEQILFNLVDNACKYAAGADDKRIHLRTEKTTDTLRLYVCDHGPGIVAPDAKRLFQPFRKSAHDAANSAPGVGLGLALSRRLARQMHGELTLDTNHPDGACFVLTLPLGAAAGGDP